MSKRLPQGRGQSHRHRYSLGLRSAVESDDTSTARARPRAKAASRPCASARCLAECRERSLLGPDKFPLEGPHMDRLMTKLQQAYPRHEWTDRKVRDRWVEERRRWRDIQSLSSTGIVFFPDGRVECTAEQVQDLIEKAPHAAWLKTEPLGDVDVYRVVFSGDDVDRLDKQEAGATASDGEPELADFNATSGDEQVRQLPQSTEERRSPPHSRHNDELKAGAGASADEILAKVASFIDLMLGTAMEKGSSPQGFPMQQSLAKFEMAMSLLSSEKLFNDDGFQEEATEVSHPSVYTLFTEPARAIVFCALPSRANREAQLVAWIKDLEKEQRYQ